MDHDSTQLNTSQNPRAKAAFDEADILSCLPSSAVLRDRIGRWVHRPRQTGMSAPPKHDL